MADGGSIKDTVGVLLVKMKRDAMSYEVSKCHTFSHHFSVNECYLHLFIKRIILQNQSGHRVDDSAALLYVTMWMLTRPLAACLYCVCGALLRRLKVTVWQMFRGGERYFYRGGLHHWGRSVGNSPRIRPAEGKIEPEQWRETSQGSSAVDEWEVVSQNFLSETAAASLTQDNLRFDPLLFLCVRHPLPSH